MNNHNLNNNENIELELTRIFHLQSARKLTGIDVNHICARNHGHSFRIEIGVKGPIRKPYGWVVDFKDMDEAFQPLFDKLDHAYLNDVLGLENPTSEYLALYIFNNFKVEHAQTIFVTVAETDKTACTIRRST